MNALCYEGVIEYFGIILLISVRQFCVFEIHKTQEI